jgi:hypothetical protein
MSHSRPRESTRRSMAPQTATIASRPEIAALQRARCEAQRASVMQPTVANCVTSGPPHRQVMDEAQRASVIQPTVANRVRSGPPHCQGMNEAQRASVIQPRVARSATLGPAPHQGMNPDGVPSIGDPWHTPDDQPLNRRNPVGVRVMRDALPRVAAAPQPWALSRNPFGIDPLPSRLPEGLAR